MPRPLHALSVHVPRRCVPRGSSLGWSKTSTTHRTTAAPVRPNGREQLSLAGLSALGVRVLKGPPQALLRPLQKWGELALVKRSALRAGFRAPAPTEQTSGATRSLASEARPLQLVQRSTWHGQYVSPLARRRWLSTPAQIHAALATSKSVAHFPRLPLVPFAVAGSCPPVRAGSPVSHLPVPPLLRSPAPQLP